MNYLSTALETSNRYQNDGCVFNNKFKCGEAKHRKSRGGVCTKEDSLQMNKESGVTEHTIVYKIRENPGEERRRLV